LTFNVVFISAQRKAGFVASCRSRHCVRRCFSAPCVSSIRITSPDASPGIATWHDPRQPCVPARSSPALRLISPVTGSLSSLVSKANLSTTLFLVD
jgi:hypothetical protein